MARFAAEWPSQVLRDSDGPHGTCSEMMILRLVRNRARKACRVAAAVNTPLPDVRFFEKSAFSSDGAGPDPVRMRPQRTSRADTADSVFAKRGLDVAVPGSSWRGTVRRCGRMPRYAGLRQVFRRARPYDNRIPVSGSLQCFRKGT